MIGLGRLLLQKRASARFLIYDAAFSDIPCFESLLPMQIRITGENWRPNCAGASYLVWYFFRIGLHKLSYKFAFSSRGRRAIALLCDCAEKSQSVVAFFNPALPYVVFFVANACFPPRRFVCCVVESIDLRSALLLEILLKWRILPRGVFFMRFPHRQNTEVKGSFTRLAKHAAFHRFHSIRAVPFCGILLDNRSNQIRKCIRMRVCYELRCLDCALRFL